MKKIYALALAALFAGNAMADEEDYAYYYKPTGTFFQAYNGDKYLNDNTKVYGSGCDYYTYPCLIVPIGQYVEFVNASSITTNSTWYVGTSVWTANSKGNLYNTFAPSKSFAMPQLQVVTAEEKTLPYQMYSEEIYTNSKGNFVYPYMKARDCMSWLSPICQRSLSYKNNKAIVSDSIYTIDGKNYTPTGFTQAYEKPATSLFVEKTSLWVAYPTSGVVLADGCTLTMEVYALSDNSTIATLTATSENVKTVNNSYYRAIEFLPTDGNAFVINKAYGVRVTGFDTNVGGTINVIANDLYCQYEFNAAQITFKEDDAVTLTTTSPSEEDGVVYNYDAGIGVGFKAFQDGGYLSSSSTTTFDSGIDNTISPIKKVVYTSRPWTKRESTEDWNPDNRISGNSNYTLEGMPDWLSYTVDETKWQTNARDTLTFTPEVNTGAERTATVKLVSNLTGFVVATFNITQNGTTATAIKEVETEAVIDRERTVSGMPVPDNYRGIVISGGRKVLRK